VQCSSDHFPFLSWKCRATVIAQHFENHGGIGDMVPAASKALPSHEIELKAVIELKKRRLECLGDARPHVNSEYLGVGNDQARTYKTAVLTTHETCQPRQRARVACQDVRSDFPQTRQYPLRGPEAMHFEKGEQT
jgi:hypothetical protein